MEKLIQAAKQLVAGSDAILVSASNGLSIAEGYNIFSDDANFQYYFKEFKSKYGITGLIQGVFATLPANDHQRYMQAVHQFLIDDYQPTQVFADLKKLIGDKDYFVITSNADTHFQLNHFDQQKIYEVEGNFDGLTVNSSDWKQQQARFQQFVADNQDKRVLQLELGIGARNQMIKLPLMQLVGQVSDWHYLTLNMPKEINVLPAIKNRSIALSGDIQRTFKELLLEDK